MYFKQRATRAGKWGQAVGEAGSGCFCLLREDLVLKNPEQVSVQGPPRLKTGSGMGWKPFTQNPSLQAGKHPWSLYHLLLSFWGCSGNAATREGLGLH